MKFELNVSLGLVWIGLNLFVLVGFKIMGFILDFFFFFLNLDRIPFKLCAHCMIIVFYYEDKRQQLIYNVNGKLRYFIENSYVTN